MGRLDTIFPRLVLRKLTAVVVLAWLPVACEARQTPATEQIDGNWLIRRDAPAAPR